MEPPRRITFLLPLLLGVAMTLAVRGYQYGGGNHGVYLVAPIRQAWPELLGNDWWTTKTLQYHVVFTNLTAWLMKLGIERAAFLAMYLGLVVLMHTGWLRLVLRLGFDARVYLVSVVLYYLSAGGVGLGSYQFLQDSSFLPGNVANVAMLWGVVMWVEGGLWPAAIWLAVAGLFHLNHAIVGIGFWLVMIGLYSLSRTRWLIGSAGVAQSRVGEGRGEGLVSPDVEIGPSPQPSPTGGERNFAPSAHVRPREREWTPVLVGGFALIVVLALPNIIPAARITLAGRPKLPLAEFVEVYVRLRHPHHYDPLSWPIALWVGFLWPIPFAYLAWKRMRSGPQVWRAGVVFLYFCALMGAALVFAGVVFVSEALIQMSLFRFSIYPKLLTCVGAAALLPYARVLARPAVGWMVFALPMVLIVGLFAIRFLELGTVSTFIRDNMAPLVLSVVLMAGCLAYAWKPRLPQWLIAAFIAGTFGVLVAGWGRWGLRLGTEDRSEQAYLAMCAWVRENTPVDAVFLVPPNEQLFRIHARRAIVVNFKGVPQLSSELGEWRRRLERVLDRPLATLPRGFYRTHAALGRRYDELPAEHLALVAREYRARFVVTSRPVEGLGRCVFENESCRLYDLSQ